MTKLSVIVPFYNETAFLRTTLLSIFNQRIKDLEVIVVNDNPENYSKDALAQLTRGFDVKIIHNPENLGLSATRNVALDAATGDWIGFLDADDYYTVAGLFGHFEYAKIVGADMVHALTNYSSIGVPDAKVLARNSAMHTTPGLFKGLRDAPQAQFIVSCWSSLYRRRFLDKNALRFDEEQRKFEDRIFVLNAVTAAKSIAFYDQAVRVWRRRTGSITTSEVTPEIQLLQIQLIEKCIAHMRAQVASGQLALRFEKRELFNCVSRLIWDMDAIFNIANAPDTPLSVEMATRIQALLGDDSFDNAFFDDPMIKLMSRVGQPTRFGRISRVTFFEVHRLMREGDFVGAVQLIEACKVETPFITPNKMAETDLILHVGLHKTGTTYLQHHLVSHRDALRKRGVLVPKTGYLSADATFNMRDGGSPGFQGLASAARDQAPKVWNTLYQEIENSGLKTVVISSENMLFPTSETRETHIRDLMTAVSGFRSVKVIALARNPVVQLESFYKEWVSCGARSGARSIEEFCVDHAPSFMDMGHLFAPFEDALGSQVVLGDFDQLKKGGLWDGFCTLAGLPRDLATQATTHYPSADRESTQVLQLMNMLVPNAEQRRNILRSYFSTYDAPRSKLSLLPPTHRLALLDMWQEKSQDFAAARGYAPNLDQLRQEIQDEDWSPLNHIDIERIQALITSAAQSIPDAGPTYGHRARRPISTSFQTPQVAPRRMSITIRPKPWLVKMIRALTRGSAA